jgi:hypothetical protein
MANGNLGELWFQLGLKDNSSKGLQKIIDKLKKGEDNANALLRAMQGFGTKESGFKSQAEKAQKFADILNELNRRIAKLYKDDKEQAKYWQNGIKNALAYLDMLQRINIKQGEISELKSLNPNVDTSKLKEAVAMLENLNKQLLKLQDKPKGRGGGGVDDANVLQGYAKALSMTFRDVKQITDQFKKENPLSVFTGGTAKVEADIARVTEKLAKLRDLMAEGSKKGYNTSMLGGSIIELQGVLNRLQSAHGNKSLLTDAAQMKNLLSDVAVEMTKATAAASAYGREKGKVIAQTKEADAQKRKIEERLNATRSLIELQNQLNHIANQAENGVGMKGLRLGADVTNLSAKIGELRDFANKLGGVNPALMGLGGRRDFADYKSEAKSLTYALQEAIQAQRELNSAKSAVNNKEQRDATKAANEYIAALKQLDRETEQAKQRIQSMEKALANLQEKRFTSKMLGLDTSEADAKIAHMKKQLTDLYNILNALNTNGINSIGLLGNIGNGREVQAANNLASAYDKANRELASTYDKANKEVERGVKLEEQRAQKIAESAAKARNDLANAFGKVNEEAGKMNSALSDIKSLFLQGGLVYGAKQFFDSVVQTGGEIVQQHIALRSILGDVQKADELFAQTQQLALESPFKFGELNRDVKQLAAFGVEANDLYDTAKRLADIASGLGVSFERLGLAYGQVKARSWLDGKELRQFAYAGLPLLKMITNLYNQEGKNGKNNYTASDVKGMITKREVSFEDVQKVLWQMTDEGGQFYNMQYVLSDTLLGRWNKLIDAWDIMLGKFADGKGIIGGTFTFILNRVTDLVLALDKLSPAAIAVGGLFAGKAIYSSMSSKMGIGSNLAALKAEQQAKLRTYAVEQQQLLIEGKITLEKMRQNIADRQGMLNSKIMTRNAVEQAALEGRLGVLKLQKAFSEKLISPEMVKQLTLMGLITAKQEEMILNGNRFGLAMQTAGAKIKGAFAAIGGWWTIGIGAVIGMITSVVSDINAVKEKAESLASPSSERMKPYYDILAQDKATNDAELKKQVESMKELLVKSDAYTKTIDEQISKAKGLNEQYDILKQGVDKAKGVAEGDADLIAGAIGATGGWTGLNPFNDKVTENIEDMRKAMAAYNVRLSAMDDNTKSHLNSIADSYLSAADKTRTLEEKIRIVADRGGADWLWFKMRVGKWNKDIGESMKDLGEDANDVTGAIKEIAEDDVPKIIAYIQKKQGLFGDNFKTWCQNNKSRFHDMLSEILGSANLLVPEINKKLKELTGVTFTGDGNDVAQTPLNSIQRRVFSNLNFNKKQYGLLAPNLVDGSYYESKNKVKTALQGLYNEYQSRLNGGATQQEITSSKADYQALLKAAEKGLGFKFVPEDKKSNKYPKDTTRQKEEAAARKADQADLKALQARLKLIKDAYSMYKQYYDKLHNEAEAANIVASKFKGQGLSNDDITKIMSVEGLRSLMEDYVTRVRNWSPRQAAEMKNSKDSAIAEGVREIDDIDFRKMTEGMSDFSSSVEKNLKEMDRRWKSYQSLLKATGNPVLSATASGLSSDKNSIYGNGFEGLYSDYLRNYISGISRHVGGLDAEKLKGMSDEDIKKFAGSVFAGDDPKKIDGITASLKKLRDTIVDTEFQDAVNAYLSMIGKAMDEAAVTGRANGEYQTTKTNLDNALSTGIIDKASHDVALGIAKAVRDSAILKSTAGYMALSSYGNGMADEDFTKAYDNALKSLKDQLDANIISASQYTSELKKLEDIQRKRTQSGLFGDSSSKSAFVKGGLPGLLSYYNDKANARRVYLKGQGYSAEDIEKDEQVLKYSKLANKINDTIDKLGDLSTCISAITGVFTGLQQATQSLSEMFDALGNESMANFFSDTSDVIGAVGSVFSPVGDIVKSAMSGDVGGIVSNAISAPIKLFTSPITAFAKLHDKKLERQIKELERANKNIENIRSSIERNLSNTLGGVYAYKSKQKDADQTGSFEYYDQMYSSYTQQLANLQERRDREDRKKDTDQDAIADYDSQIDEISDKIATLAKDLANSIYGIDVKSWAKELTDTLVEAWAAGEDAAEAYGDKVKDIMKSVAKNMLSQMYVEQYFKPLEKLIEQRMEERKGKLQPEDIAEFAESLMDASSLATDAIDQTLEELKKRGVDLTNSNSSTMSSSIQGITESTADVLSSYINAIRADVSILRQMQGVYLPKIDVTTQAQLQQLTMISENTLRNADAAVAIQASVSDMRDMMNRAQNNTKPFYVYVK